MFHLPNPQQGFRHHMFVVTLHLHNSSFTLCHSSALGFSFNMTKRDSFLAGINSPRAPTSMQRRQLHFEGQSSSGATSSGQRPQPSTAMVNLPLGTRQLPHQFLYLMLLPTISMKKPIHSKRRSNNSIEFSILTSSQRSFLLIRQASIALW